MKSEGIGDPLELASECDSEESFHGYSDKSLSSWFDRKQQKDEKFVEDIDEFHNNPLELLFSEDKVTLHRFRDNYQDENLILLKK